MKKTTKKKEVAVPDMSGHADLLKSTGLKSTQGRINVLDALLQSDSPQSVEQICSTLGSAAPDRATVYRIVDQFVKVELAKEIHFNDSIVRYEIIGLEEHDHCCHHVVCKNCGIVSHVESDEVEKAIEKMASKAKDFKIIDTHSLELYGICKKCAK